MARSFPEEKEKKRKGVSGRGQCEHIHKATKIDSGRNEY